MNTHLSAVIFVRQKANGNPADANTHVHCLHHPLGKAWTNITRDEEVGLLALLGKQVPLRPPSVRAMVNFAAVEFTLASFSSKSDMIQGCSQ